MEEGESSRWHWRAKAVGRQWEQAAVRTPRAVSVRDAQGWLYPGVCDAAYPDFIPDSALTGTRSANRVITLPITSSDGDPDYTSACLLAARQSRESSQHHHHVAIQSNEAADPQLVTTLAIAASTK